MRTQHTHSRALLWFSQCQLISRPRSQRKEKKLNKMANTRYSYLGMWGCSPCPGLHHVAGRYRSTDSFTPLRQPIKLASRMHVFMHACIIQCGIHSHPLIALWFLFYRFHNLCCCRVILPIVTNLSIASSFRLDKRLPVLNYLLIFSFKYTQ